MVSGEGEDDGWYLFLGGAIDPRWTISKDWLEEDLESGNEGWEL